MLIKSLSAAATSPVPLHSGAGEWGWFPVLSRCRYRWGRFPGEGLQSLARSQRRPLQSQGLTRSEGQRPVVGDVPGESFAG